MCEQTSFEYRGGDIVWVKLGVCWWPGEVIDFDALPKEVTEDFKKRPLAAVKFFQEDSYEYVKNINQIYTYNCKKKHDFIKKGLDLFKAKNTFMEKFPEDVRTAEEKTGGDQNIVEEILTQGETRVKYTHLFGAPKKSKDESKKKRKSAGNTPSEPSTSAVKNLVSRTFRPRNSNSDDGFEVRVLVQTPEKGGSLEEAQKGNYSCTSCGFQTSSIDVIVIHNKSHIQGVYAPRTFSTKRAKKTLVKKPKPVMKMTHSKTRSIDEDLALMEKGVQLYGDSSEEDVDEDLDEPKPKRKRQSRKRKPKKDGTKKKAEKKMDICKNLLAEWEEEEAEEEEEDESNTSMNNESTLSTDMDVDSSESKKPASKKSSKKDADKSCFDFEEEEETILNTSVGRKIPRVIPPSEKRSSSEEQLDSTKSVPSGKTEKNVKSDTAKSEDVEQKPESEKVQEEDDNVEAFKNVLESTSVPELPEVPSTEIFEKNFHSGKTIKFPDKSENEAKTDDTEGSTEDQNKKVKEKVPKKSKVLESGSSSVEETQIKLNDEKETTEKKLINPKKRFVKSFEDFENQYNRQAAAAAAATIETEPIEKSEELSKNEGAALVEVSKLKTQLMSKLEHPVSDSSPVGSPEPTKSVRTRRQTRLAKHQDESSDAEQATPVKSSRKSKSSDEQEVPVQERGNSDTSKKTKNVLQETVKENSPASRGSPRTRSRDKLSKLSKEAAMKARSSSEDVSENESKQTTAETGESKHETVPTRQSKRKRKSTSVLSSHSADEADKSQVEHVGKSTKRNRRYSGKDFDEGSISMPVTGDADMESNYVAESKDINEKKSLEEGTNKISNEGNHSTKMLNNMQEEKSENTDAVLDSNKSEMETNKTESNLQLPTDTAPSKETANNSEELLDATKNDMSALSTLAAVSELSDNLDVPQPELPKLAEGSVTIVTELDLENTQVEIANIPDENAEQQSKPVTVTSFSVDFSDNFQAEGNKTEVKDASDKTDEMDIETFTAEDVNRIILSGPKDVKIVERSNTKTHAERKAFPEANVINGDKIQTSPKKMKEPFRDTHDKIPSLHANEENKSIISDTYTTLVSKPPPKYTSTSKLLNILTDGKESLARNETGKKTAPAYSKFENRSSKFGIKSSPTKAASKGKPIILSERIIKPVSETESVSVQKVSSKGPVQQDIEDIDTFIIQKSIKKHEVSSESDSENTLSGITKQFTQKNVSMQQQKGRGKAKILQQTIITPTGDVIQPNAPQLVNDDNMFDIDSMPIVLDDQILTPESIEKMPVVISDSLPAIPKPKTTSTPVLNKPRDQPMKILNKSAPLQSPSSVMKTYGTQKPKPHRILTSGTKLLKPTSSPSVLGKQGKYIVVPSSTPTGNKYTVGKKPPIARRTVPSVVSTTSTINKVASIAEPSGNKIMIVTNQQGQQSRVLLTPAQQKLLGYQTPGSKIVKSALKGNILQRVSPKIAIPSTAVTAIQSKASNIISHAVVNSKGEIISTSTPNLVITDGQVLMSVKPQQIKTTFKPDGTLRSKKIPVHSQKLLLSEGPSFKPKTPPQKTIVIKNQQGQIVKTIQGNDDELLDKRVAEQVQAIKASGSFVSAKSKPEPSIVPKSKPIIKRSYQKKPMPELGLRSTTRPTFLSTTITTTSSKINKSEVGLPPLAPISPKKPDVETAKFIKSDEKDKLIDTPQKPLNQLIIQDALGNQTTITEGQILALPSETIDGQPQSYMLVTLDESGNLAPLDNEALLSLDPNLCLGGDLSNMVLQVDSTVKETKAADVGANLPVQNVETSVPSTTTGAETAVQMLGQQESNANNLEMQIPLEENLTAKSLLESSLQSAVAPTDVVTTTQNMDITNQGLDAVESVTCSLGNDPNQQLIITGDPVSTQKFIESLAEGNADLASLLAGAEGNILIHADGQQILINTDADNQAALPGVADSSEGDGNPIFASPTGKSQDILAAALADTDVFQQDQNTNKLVQSQLSPNSSLYPNNVTNVLGTTLSLSSPIMTPLEVPSSNNKKIPDEETDILTEVPKNVDLPITITDPSISQTVSQQQVASLMGSDLSTNLELPLAIPDQVAPLTSAEMNSPSFGYSLPSLDDSVDINQKSFSGPISMPLLTDEPQESGSNDLVVSSPQMKNEPLASEEDTNVKLEENETSSSSTSLPLILPHVNASTPFFPHPDELKDSEDEPQGLCRLGGAICSSLSEPPHDMFDISDQADLELHVEKKESANYISPSGTETCTDDTSLNMKKEVDNGESTLASGDDKDKNDAPEINVNASCGKDGEVQPDNLNTLQDNEEGTVPSGVTDDVKQETANDSSENVQSKADDEISGRTVDTANEDAPKNLCEEAVQSGGVLQNSDRIDGVDSEGKNNDTPSSHAPVYSENSSPLANIDENSCEIPVQPQIVTNLSSSSFETPDANDSADSFKEKFID